MASGLGPVMNRQIYVSAQNMGISESVAENFYLRLKVENIDSAKPPLYDHLELTTSENAPPGPDPDR